MATAIGQAVDQDLKQEFVNNSPGWLGATVITGRNNDPKAVPIGPGDRIFLSREEQILTSRSYKTDEDSPFNSGLDAVAAPGEVKDDMRVPFDESVKAPADTAADDAPPAEEITGVLPQPAGDGAVGQQAQDEIAGTPEAQKKAQAQTPAAPPVARAPSPSTSPSVPKTIGTP